MADTGDGRQEIKIVMKNVPYTLGSASSTRAATRTATREYTDASGFNATQFEDGEMQESYLHPNDRRFTDYEGKNLSQRAAKNFEALGVKLAGKGKDAKPEIPPTSSAPVEVTRNSGLAFVATAILGALDKNLLTGPELGPENPSPGISLQHDYILILFMSGAMGVTITNIFNDPEGPYNQPVNVFFGHFLSVIAGIISTYVPGNAPNAALVMNSIAVGLATLLMRTFKVYHPPATATASCVVAIYNSYGAEYRDGIIKAYFMRTIISTLIILGVALASNLNKGFQYPRTWAWHGVDTSVGKRQFDRLAARAKRKLDQEVQEAKDKLAIEAAKAKGWLQGEIKKLLIQAYNTIVDGGLSFDELLQFSQDDILDNIENIKKYFTFENAAENTGGIGMIERIKEMIA